MATLLLGMDDPDERGLVIFSLRFANHRVVSAATPQELMTLVQQVKPDLVLIDTDLGGLTEKELRLILENNLQTAQIPIIYLLEAGEDAKIQHSSTIARDDYLRKPISPDQLIQTVKHRLKRRRK